jgi:hypothetical protein
MMQPTPEAGKKNKKFLVRVNDVSEKIKLTAQREKKMEAGIVVVLITNKSDTICGKQKECMYSCTVFPKNFASHTVVFGDSFADVAQIY